MTTVWTLTAVACGLFRPDLGFLDEPPPEPVEPSSRALALSRQGEVTVQLPSMNRPDDLPAPEEWPLGGEFAYHKTVEGVAIYAIPLPVAMHLLPQASGGTHLIGSARPEGFEVTGPQGGLKWQFPRARAVRSWGFDATRLFVGVPKSAPAPDAADYQVRFPRAKQAEDALSYATSGQSSSAFVRRQVTIDGTSRQGLYLPAPARATFPVQIPDNGRLTLTGTVLRPPIRHAVQSDGAVVQVRIEDGGTPTTIGELALSVGRSVPGSFDLSAFAGQHVDLVLETLPGASKDFDYVFVEAPVVSSEGHRPQRILALFVDTLRPDHLGFMGYPRDTSPVLDRLAQHAAVFTEARSVAPWTLPSARAALSGHQPEHWKDVPTLAERLGALGFRTEGIVGNAFLSAPFEMQRGFDRYHYTQLLPAHDVVDRVEAIVQRFPDRDLFVLAHFMEPHLPYTEPWSFRFKYTGLRPRAVAYYARTSYSGLPVDDPGFAVVKDHFVGRYDQNIAAVDHAIASAIEAMGPDATVLLFSDHGEEFWEHGSFEHGHAFWDEVMRVPFVMRGPGIPAGRFDSPVSLLDLTPTVLDLVGMDAGPTVGRSVLPIARGETGAADAFAARPQAFGRPLYDDDGWGVLSDGSKWWSRGGAQARFDLTTDPAEQTNLVAAGDDARYSEALSDALARQVDHVWRLTFEARHPWPHEVLVTVSHPKGVRSADLAYAPRGNVVPEPVMEGGRVQLTIPAGVEPPPGLYVRPAGQATDVRGLAVSMVGKNLVAGANVTFDLRERPPANRRQFLRTGKASYQVVVDLAWAPVPDGEAVPGNHPELQAELQQLGYLE